MTRCLSILAVAAVALALTAAADARTLVSCSTRGLVVWFDTQGDATAGSTFFHLELTNLSGRPCVLRGYPGVAGVDLAGRQLGTAAGRNPQAPVRTIVLAAGRTASAVLQVADVANYPAATCRPVSAAGFRVYPPNQTASRLVPFPFRACSRRGPAYLHVEAVTRATQ